MEMRPLLLTMNLIVWLYKNDIIHMGTLKIQGLKCQETETAHLFGNGAEEA
jgi:hypothetical protein